MWSTWTIQAQGRGGITYTRTRSHTLAHALLLFTHRLFSSVLFFQFSDEVEIIHLANRRMSPPPSLYELSVSIPNDTHTDYGVDGINF